MIAWLDPEHHDLRARRVEAALEERREGRRVQRRMGPTFLEPGVIAAIDPDELADARAQAEAAQPACRLWYKGAHRAVVE